MAPGVPAPAGETGTPAAQPDPSADPSAGPPGAIEFWFDFGSGYAWFAAQEIDRLGERVGRAVLWRPFMLGAAFKQTGARALTATPLKDDYARRDWARIARLHGLGFTLPPNHPAIALPATRLFYWIEDRDSALAVRFAKAVFDACYLHGLDTANVEAVAGVAATFGLDHAEAVAGESCRAVRDRTRAIGEGAVARGVFGSPFFIVDGEPFWGWDRLGMLEQWIVRGGW